MDRVNPSIAPESGECCVRQNTLSDLSLSLTQRFAHSAMLNDRKSVRMWSAGDRGDTRVYNPSLRRLHQSQADRSGRIA